MIETFFTGEIIGKKYSFLTRKWDVDFTKDQLHWSKFEEFKCFKNTFNDDDFDHSSVQESPVLFMRWKEQFCLPDHRIKDIEGNSWQIGTRNDNFRCFLWGILLRGSYKGNWRHPWILLCQGFWAGPAFNPPTRKEKFLFSFPISVKKWHKVPFYAPENMFIIRFKIFTSNTNIVWIGQDQIGSITRLVNGLSVISCNRWREISIKCTNFRRNWVGFKWLVWVMFLAALKHTPRVLWILCVLELTTHHRLWFSREF